jgi:trans-aconitate methyltransferase
MSDSPDQHWNAEQYAQNARFVADLGLAVVDLLAPQRGERILDLGCGDGALTLKLVERGCIVVGVDSSPEMVSAARSLGLDAQVMDGHVLPFENQFDAVFSNAALHWMQEPTRVIDAVWRALKPQGRFVGEMGGKGNVSIIISALETALAGRALAVPSPWFFPSPAEYRKLLEVRGFEVQCLDLIPRPTPLPGAVEAWLETFAQPYFVGLSLAEKNSFLAEVVELLRPQLWNATNGHWQADYVRLRFSARKL